MRVGPKYKICRRLGERVFAKCQTTKFTVSGIEKKGARPRALSEYGTQLLEKQKAKYTYGLTEKQFANYVAKARAMKNHDPVTNLFRLLESRLDNVVYRLGLAPTRAFARQMVSHGHVLVNDRRVTIPSYRTRPGEIVAVRPQSAAKGLFKDFTERLKNYQWPAWLSFDETKKAGTLKGEPVAGSQEFNLNLNSIIEFYSRV